MTEDAETDATPVLIDQREISAALENLVGHLAAPLTRPQDLALLNVVADWMNGKRYFVPPATDPVLDDVAAVEAAVAGDIVDESGSVTGSVNETETVAEETASSPQETLAPDTAPEGSEGSET